ncbi:unnamed protein product [Paramecium sonneborni]|uniref:Uncharacterized protein n=1 Tax=Paramecium sonneborni TaxID=65129 RepID=A0A8S1MX61_9CILI|nr:unnamed protein product [Paramecium sonneborni]
MKFLQNYGNFRNNEMKLITQKIALILFGSQVFYQIIKANSILISYDKNNRIILVGEEI